MAEQLITEDERKVSEAIDYIKSFESFYNRPVTGDEDMFDTGANCMRKLAHRDFQMIKRILEGKDV